MNKNKVNITEMSKVLITVIIALVLYQYDESECDVK